MLSYQRRASILTALSQAFQYLNSSLKPGTFSLERIYLL
jgi:hypothetical protein